MLSGLKQTLKQGNSFPITLSFAKAGQVTATATVAKAGATMPSMDQTTCAAWVPCQCWAAESNLSGNEQK
jgi:hypothetical protein